jgi:hypothetical protein
MVKLNLKYTTKQGEYMVEKSFESYPEDYIENLCERYADKGYALTERAGSDSKKGAIDITKGENSLTVTWEKTNA